ncbi:hypothetical protein niasHT_027045 [Heterodera trifolii]|uniref:Transmembrane protein n=1 Tax=Heterodera trifolii TaxID=157864 RepID=A0ABD2JTI1_9BILA
MGSKKWQFSPFHILCFFQLPTFLVIFDLMCWFFIKMFFCRPFCATVLLLSFAMLFLILSALPSAVESALVRHRRHWLIGARGAGGGTDLLSIGSGNFWSLFGLRR